MKRTPKTLLLITALLTLASVVPAAGAAGAAEAKSTTPTTASAGVQSNIDAGAAAAMASQQGISVAEARTRLGNQQALGAKGAQIEKALAGHAGGSYLDGGGRLVVNTLDAAADAAVRRDGALPHRVDDSQARLDSIMKQLDRQAKANGAGSVQGWYVDVPTNTVVVTATTGANDAKAVAITKLAKSFGASVRIESRSASEAPRQTAQYLRGGYEVKMPSGPACSLGFNTRDSLNRNVVLTAGHCIEGGNFSRGGLVIGAGRTKDFPTNDYGTFWNAYPSYWVPTASVYKYNGTYVNVRGVWNTPTVGATVCKSGRTTGYSCGTITALNRTVNYGSGRIVYGLVQHNNCVEGGDSGGSNISAGAYALGMTSGASMSGGKCLSKIGRANVSYYQPIGEALATNKLRVLVSS